MSARPAPVLALHEISLYNTGRVSPEKIIAAFAARGDQFQRIVDDLGAEQPKSRAQHHLVVGQRGMGKTMLLARIGAELRTVPALAARFIPLAFAEEQYAVDRLSKFWLNCLDSLADAREDAHDAKAVEEIDGTVARLQAGGVRPVKDDQPLADEAYEAFCKAAKEGGQRPVLLVDNLQLVFERLDSGQQHSLRELLMRPGSPILIGTSPSLPAQSQDYGAAFYDHFKVHYLRPLEEGEMRELLLHLADAAQRDDVRQRVLQHPARLTVLRQLTGGNPRTTLTLFFLYAEDFAPSVFGDLEGLLDRVTPLYKARFEELTAQQQVVASAIANHWDPVTAATLTTNTGLPPGTISAQLDRLEKLGFIERTELFGETRTGYLLAERFFNIWFLMRSASRRQRREVEFLTRFLESFYEPVDRSRIAQHLMNEEWFSPDRFLWSQAVAGSLTEPEIAAELIRHNELLALRESATESRRRMRELIDLDGLPPATIAFADLRQKLMLLVPEDAEVAPEEFAKAVLGNRAMFKNRERERMAALADKLSASAIQSVLETTQKGRAADERRYSVDAASWYSHRLASGQIRSVRDTEDWNRAFAQVRGKERTQMMVDTLPNDFKVRLTESNIDLISTTIQPIETAPPWEWLVWGKSLDTQLHKYPEAEIAYRKTIDTCLEELARVVVRESEVQVEMKRTTKEHKELFKQESNGLGTPARLQTALNKLKTRQVELVQLLAENRSLLEKVSMTAWCRIGIILSGSPHRLIDAENAARKAILLDPSDPTPFYLLGIVLKNDSRRHSEAELAFCESISRDASNARLWDGLGDLYSLSQDKVELAVNAFENALRLDPLHESAHQKRLSLRRDFIGEGAAARSLMTALQALPPGDALSITHLHEALSAAYDFNWGLACDQLVRALTISVDGFNAAEAEYWNLASAVLLHLNYGTELLAFLDQRDDTVTHLRPWVEAVRALHLTDRRTLQNIAPEIRTTAEIFFDKIEDILGKLPDKTRRRPLPPLTEVGRTR